MSEADHEATMREQISADAGAGEAERAVFDTTMIADEAPLASGGSAPLPGEPALPGGQLGAVHRSRTPQLLAGGGLVAVILFVLWRLKLRRTPPTPSERLTESAKGLSAASLAAGSRAAERLTDNAGPAAERAAELAKRGAATYADTAQRAATAAKPVVASAAASAAETAQRAATAAKPVVAAAATVAAREGFKVGSKVGAKAADNAGDMAAKASDVAGDVASIAASAGQNVASTVADVAETLGDAGHAVHKTWRRWTFRLWFGTFAAIGYVLGARAGRERYDQIMGLAGKVSSSF